MWVTAKCGKFSKIWGYQTTLPASLEICILVKKQQLVPDMEKQIGSKSGQEYFKAVYCDPATLMAESEEELKSLLIKEKEQSEQVDLKLNIQKAKIMASDPITSWPIERETIETVTDFIFLDSKITADGHCSHEIKRHLLLG